MREERRVEEEKEAKLRQEQEEKWKKEQEENRQRVEAERARLEQEKKEKEEEEAKKREEEMAKEALKAKKEAEKAEEEERKAIGMTTADEDWRIARTLLKVSHSILFSRSARPANYVLLSVGSENGPHETRQSKQTSQIRVVRLTAPNHTQDRPTYK